MTQTYPPELPTPSAKELLLQPPLGSFGLAARDVETRCSEDTFLHGTFCNQHLEPTFYPPPGRQPEKTGARGRGVERWGYVNWLPDLAATPPNLNMAPLPCLEDGPIQLGDPVAGSLTSMEQIRSSTPRQTTTRHGVRSGAQNCKDLLFHGSGVWSTTPTTCSPDSA